MTAVEQKKAAKEFAEYWKDKGYEKGQSQPFWMSLLGDVLGADHPEQVIEFEDQVKMEHTSFIDGYIPLTKVLIEQKSLGKDLDAPIKQSDGSLLTPFQQAKKYIPDLPVSKHPRWVVTSNFSEFRIYDMERPNDPAEVILLADLEKEVHRLQFLVNQKSEHIRKVMEVSLEAGEIVGIIYEALSEQYGKNMTPEMMHSLNVLCVRLVFCLYAESAGIFGRFGMFGEYLHNHKQNARDALIKLFDVLDTPEDKRDPFMDDDLAEFPYVNGGLFREKIILPKITPEIAYEILYSTSDGFKWADISPTIFGAIFESTLNTETRRKGGMHYTSTENIHKVIDPLFLDDLRAELEDILTKNKTARGRKPKLDAFRNKLASLKFLDPACGSGNFLTETYLSLRRLENDAIRALTQGQIQFEDTNPICVSIEQFSGIEINDFAVTVARTALWIAEAQMLQETVSILNMQIEYLPLTTAAHIVAGNALRMDWEDVVPKHQLNYIMGNPPFSGARIMSPAQKKDIADTFGPEWKNAGNLDYVACWFKKAADFMQRTSIRSALVATNSISQGESVGTLWEPLFRDGVHIDFAWQTFRWDSEASVKAHVHVVIIGFSTLLGAVERPILYGDNGSREVENINGYLVDGAEVSVVSRQTPLCEVPEIGIGNKLLDWGEYLFTSAEKDDFLRREPDAAQYFFPFYGGKEFIYGKPIYCLWLGECTPEQLRRMPSCLKKVENVRAHRKASKSKGTVSLADRPTRFHVENMPDGDYLAIPVVSSEKRRYIPIGFMHDDVMCGQKLMLMPGATVYHFGVLTSNVHNAWMRAVSGRMKSDYSYSKDIVYNNFPWPDPTPKQRERIEKTAQAILDARALYPDSSLADLYNETTMPPELRKAHQDNDRAVMAAYGFRENGHWLSEPETVARLMQMYADLTEETEQGTE